MAFFRDVEKQFVIINDPKYVMFLGKESIANSILCYGYVDHQAGLTYQTLASTLYEDGDFVVVDNAEVVSLKIRADSVASVEIIPVYNKALTRKYENMLEIINIYYEDEEVVASRSAEEIDQFRHQNFPDDVQVLFIKEGLRPEGIWVRNQKLLKKENGVLLFEGVLLNEPHADFGIHAGNKVLFATGIVDDKGTRICAAIL